jgi:hypothetical protein
MADPNKFADSRQNQEFMKAENVSPITAGISTKYGINSNYFGDADLEAARKQGFTNLQIKDYLDKNPSVLRETNVKGGGGVYDEIVKALSPTTATATTTAAAAAIPTPEPARPVITPTQEFRASPEKFEDTRGLTTEYGIDPTYFGAEDLKAARLQGISDREIKDFLDKNIAGLLREGNLPGKGGVYDQHKPGL